jgi:hypothetical protein
MKYTVTRHGTLIAPDGTESTFDPNAPVCMPYIAPRFAEYMSPASDRMITDRAERREDLKRHNCIDAGDMPKLNNGMARKKKYGRAPGMRWEGDQ